MKSEKTEGEQPACRKLVKIVINLSHNLGVDLNRNYDYKWGLDNIGSSNGECNEDYRGPAPFSEPETEAIKNYVERNKKLLQLVINFHAY